MRQSRELSELRRPLKFYLFVYNRGKKKKTNQRTSYHIYCNCSTPRVIPTLISDITDQPGVITKRDDTRSLLLRPDDYVAFAKENPSGIGSGNSKNRLLPRPVDLVAFAKENPSYQGPGNSKNWLLLRLRPVRVHHAYQYPVRPLY